MNTVLSLLSAMYSTSAFFRVSFTVCRYGQKALQFFSICPPKKKIVDANK